MGIVRSSCGFVVGRSPLAQAASEVATDLRLCLGGLSERGRGQGGALAPREGAARRAEVAWETTRPCPVEGGGLSSRRRDGALPGVLWSCQARRRRPRSGRSAAEGLAAERVLGHRPDVVARRDPHPACRRDSPPTAIGEAPPGSGGTGPVAPVRRSALLAGRARHRLTLRWRVLLAVLAGGCLAPPVPPFGRHESPDCLPSE